MKRAEMVGVIAAAGCHGVTPNETLRGPIRGSRGH